MSKGEGRVKKELYFSKLYSLLDEYKTVFVVNVDNVGSNQFHQIRQSMRGQSVVLMGKNTMVRRALRNAMAENPSYERLLSTVRGNVGFIFTKGDLKEVRASILSNRVKAPAKAGAFAPNNVVIPAGNTGMEPGKTSFFQALGVPTKISRGTIEIINDVDIITAGSKVGASEATLLNMLNISPFTYGMTIVSIYDNGQIFDSAILDITDEDLLKAYVSGLTRITCISLAIKYPTVASVPHLAVNGYKNLLSVAITLENYSFEAIDKIKAILADPSAFAAAAPVEAAAASTSAAAVADEEEEKDEESDDDMGFGLFD
ncbi:ribosomal protein L10-domain-containing protein [Globomyces pollinis-pini]|nr:ribosomal protein L10-domain-containing protein [Globomyces pollinis-pini]KAJ2997389.1 ribosomal protein P0 (A0) (L10E) [Globomyces sp. JEL0801]